MSAENLITRHPDANLTLGGRWGVLGCIAWIATRDAALLAGVEAEEANWAGGQSEGLTAITARELEEDLKAYFRRYCSDGADCSCFGSAWEQLVARASAGALSPAGIRDGEAAPAKIEAWEFNSPEPDIKRDGFRMLSHVGRLQFDGREVVAEWPGDVSRLFNQGELQAASPPRDESSVRLQVESGAELDDAPRGVSPGCDHPSAKSAPPKVKTKPKPKWYAQLRTLFLDEEERHAKWADKHPGSLSPRFRTAADYRRLLIDQKKWPEYLVPKSTVRYHVAALKDEFGR